VSAPTEVPPAQGSVGLRDEHAHALARAGLTFALVAPLTYLVERVLERLRAPAVDPGLILASTHMAFVWRSIVATWFGGAAAALVFLAQREGRAPALNRHRWMSALAALALVAGIVALALP
jgi:hypothetical protein